MNFFKNCRTAEELKSEYRKLAKKYHPDLNKETDTTEIMKKINAEYDNTWQKLKNIHKTAEGKTYQKETTETPEEFRDIIEKLIVLEGVVVELVGCWIWVTGSTYQHREKLKKYGLKYASKKKAWAWHAEEYAFSSKKKSLEEIRNTYGSQVFAGKSQTARLQLA